MAVVDVSGTGVTSEAVNSTRTQVGFRAVAEASFATVKVIVFRLDTKFAPADENDVHPVNAPGSVICPLASTTPLMDTVPVLSAAQRPEIVADDALKPVRSNVWVQV